MSSNLNLKYFIFYGLLTILGSFFLLLVPILNFKNDLTNKFENSQNISNEVEAVISEIPDNLEVVSKYVIDAKYTNVFFRNTDDFNLYESHIYNNKNGLEVELSELILKEKNTEFWDKVYELLSLKYPKFIVEAIRNGEGNNAYNIKENEMIIYFMNYLIQPAVSEIINIKVNYNEIKDFINFTCKLDNIYKNEDGYNYLSSKKTVALTYDDGPSGEKTEKILEILNNNKARATFFMVGNKMLSDKDTVLNVYKSGNEIGSHTYAHGNLTRQTKEEREAALLKTDEVYKSITGADLKLLRPPYGAYKKEMLNELNYSIVLWNIDTEDWRYKGSDRIVDVVLDNLSDGSIILMHDSYDRTIEATEKLLPILYAKGYQVVSVSELAKLKGVNLENNTAYRRFK